MSSTSNKNNAAALPALNGATRGSVHDLGAQLGSTEISPSVSTLTAPSSDNAASETSSNRDTVNEGFDHMSSSLNAAILGTKTGLLLQRLREYSTAQPLNVVIIHGDPTKPNDILPGGKWDEDDFYTIKRAKEALDTLKQYNFSWCCNHDTLMADLKRLKDEGKVDLVLQLCDEGWMNNSRMELHVTALLEMFEIPYTGTGPKTIGITYDKQAVIKVAESIGVPVPKSIYLADDTVLDAAKFGLAYPVMVKPNSSDGSFGITSKSVCKNEAEIKEAVKMIREVFHLECPILLQEFLDGRDINVGVMERLNEKGVMGPSTLPITEEDYSELPDHLPKICGFESKWDESSPYYKIKTRPTTLSPEIQAKMSEWSCRLFKRIDCRDYARFDWRLDAQGNPRLLEANPNCGWCWDGHLPKTAALANITYPQFFNTILKSAVHRAINEYDAKLKNATKAYVHVGRNGAEAFYNQV